MDTYQAIFSRKSVRKFKQKQIDHHTIVKIINAGLRAPSNNHLREWEFIVIQDMEMRIQVIDKVKKSYTKKGIEKWLDSWNSTDPVQRECYLKAVPMQYRMLLTAGCLILPFFKQPWPLLKPDSLSALNPFASIWCCIENILIAAAAVGICGVTRIPFKAEIDHIKKVVHAPVDYEIACYLALGYPDDENALDIKQHPVNVEDKIHMNYW